MRRWTFGVRILTLVGLVVGGVGGCAWAAQGVGDGGWRLDAVWDDGRAEFAAYEVSWPRYGEVRSGRALLVLVKEPWAPDLEVKADTPRPDGFDVLKLNHLRDVATGIYTYHQMASVFLRRDSGAVQKLVASSAEACGLSTARVLDGQLTNSTDFDGQGDRVQPYPAGALPADGLPASLRDFVTGPLPEAIEIFPSLLYGRFPALAATSYRISRRALPAVDLPAGRFAAVELRLSGPGGEHVYVFQAAAPHTLLLLRAADGTEYRLAKVERLPYWQLNRPGDETWWPESLRR